jgi:hypothetical protein
MPIHTRILTKPRFAFALFPQRCDGEEHDGDHQKNSTASIEELDSFNRYVAAEMGKGANLSLEDGVRPERQQRFAQTLTHEGSVGDVLTRAGLIGGMERLSATSAPTDSLPSKIYHGNCRHPRGARGVVQSTVAFLALGYGNAGGLAPSRTLPVLMRPLA